MVCNLLLSFLIIMDSFFSKMFSSLNVRNLTFVVTKSFVSIFLALIFFSIFPLFWPHIQAFEVLTHGKQVVLIDEKTGKILFEKNAHHPTFPASTTKVATTLYCLKLLKGKSLDTIIEAHPEALLSVTKAFKKKNNYQIKPYLLEPDGTTFHIRPKEKLSIEALLVGTMISSGNDAANTLAHYLEHGDIIHFVTGLNNYLKSLGCQKTQFKNPSGLHHPEHITTAYELSLIAREALQEPIFKDIIKIAEYVRKKTNKNEQMILKQPNRLLKEGDFFYPYATGVKTGYTEDAGYCLVASANNQKRSLIAVILGCKKATERYLDAIELFNQAFSEPLFKRKIYHAADASFKIKHPQCRVPIELSLKDDLYVEYYQSLNPAILTKVSTYPLNPPFKFNTELGTIEVYLDDQLVSKAPLYTKKEYALKWHLAVGAFIKSYKWILISSLLLLVFGLLVTLKKFKQYRSLVRGEPLRP